MSNKVTGIGIVGCGYAADDYLATLVNYPQLQVVGVADKDRARVQRFTGYWGLSGFNTMDELLSHPKVEIVLNLTSPRSHYEVSKIALRAGKHVYSEKPLAMDLSQARELTEIAQRRGLSICSAPCSILGESAQTLWKALRNNLIGPVRLVYAQVDEGPIYQMNPEKWKSASGTPWPAKDEFEVGCTLEHAAYYVSWLAAFFGPAFSSTAYSECLNPNKGVEGELSPPDTPDFSVACIRFRSGVVARLTCSIVAPHDHSLRVIGDRGMLSVDDCWHYGSPVKLHRFSKWGLKAVRYRWISRNPLLCRLFGLNGRRIPFVKRPKLKHVFDREYMDFARGVAELAASLSEKRPCRLSAKFCLHVTEIILAIQNSRDCATPYRIQTTFDPMAPMPWS